MSEPRLSPALRRAIAHDLAPVRPYAAPWRRALAFAPFGLLLVAVPPLVWGWRDNLSLVPGWASWGLSALQALLGLIVVGAALREAVPGRALSRRALLLILASALALFVGVTLTTVAVLPTIVSPAARVPWLWECLSESASVGVPALAIVAWLAWRVLPGRPALAGALCGLGAGMLTDAGFRLFCQVDQTEHIVVAHGGAVVGLMALGAGISVAIDHWRPPAGAPQPPAR